MNYKVVLTFSLKEGAADEELRRSNEEHSFPNLLAEQPGCVSIDLVKIDESKTMSVQTWETEADWWAALEAVKAIRQEHPAEQDRESILVSRDFQGGVVRKTITT